MTAAQTLLIVSILVSVVVLVLWLNRKREAAAALVAHDIHTPDTPPGVQETWAYGSAVRARAFRGEPIPEQVLPAKRNAAWCRDVCAQDQRCLATAFNPEKQSCVLYDDVVQFLPAAIKPDDNLKGIWLKPV